MNELQYIRTDRNGTKIFHDWTCPRCGGAGRSDNWWQTGYVCYACGGSGKRDTPKVVKEYTAEYAAKLEAKRLAKLPPQPDEAELLAKAEAEKLIKWKDQGFSAEGIGYVYSGDTYKHKDVLRRAGGKWCSYIRAWVLPKMVDGISGVTVTEIHAQEICNEYNIIDPEKAWELNL